MMAGPSTSPTPFWLVWSASGYPPRHRHATRRAAEIEAQRLAAGAPGHDFFVLAPVARMVSAEMTVDRYWHDDMEVPF